MNNECKKIKYLRPEDAASALRELDRKRQPGQAKEVRMYPCPECKHWHLSSKRKH